MKLNVKLKYSKGDTVSVRKPSWEEKDYYSLSYSKWTFQSIPDEVNKYVVDGYHITFREEQEPIITYLFHSYLDNFIDYHDHVPECLLTPITENHPQEIEFEVKDVFGEDINLGDQVYHGLYQSHNDGIDATNTMSFIDGGNVYKIVYAHNDYWNEGVNIWYYNNFLTVDKNGKDYVDGRRPGNNQRAVPSTLCKTVPETFYKDIINAAWDRYSYLYDEYDAYTFKCLMEHFGQYEFAYEYLMKLEEQKEKAKANKTKRKTKVQVKTEKKKSISTLKKDIDNLTVKEKEELLKLLQG